MIIRFCEKCLKPIPKERLEFLPDTLRCVNCSNEEKVEGLMDFGHKTAPALVVLPKDSEQKRKAKRAFRRSR